MTRLLALACLIALTVAAPNASAATAPARVAFSVVSEYFGSTGGAFGGVAFGGVALPDGSVVAFAYDDPAQATLVLKLQRNGALDPSFGGAGIVRLGRSFRVDKAERVGGGKLLIAGAQQDPATSSSPRIVLLRLLASGALDPSFGAGGTVTTNITSPTGGVLPISYRPAAVAGMAVAPDGSIVVTGGMPSPTETNPQSPATTDWVVAKLSPGGVPDADFGVVTIPVGSARRAAGASVVVTPTGSIVVLGRATQAPGSFATVAVLAGLTAAGTPDPAFNGGAPALVPYDGAQRLERHASGALDLIGDSGIVRFGAGGTLDTSFAAGGRFAPGEDVFPGSYVTTPDGGALLTGLRAATGAADPGRPPVDPDRQITLHRLTASGTIAGSTSLYTPFGGGTVSPSYTEQLPLAQNTFHGELLRRDDGSYLLLGGLGISHSTGRHDSLRAPFVAMQSFTPTLTADRSFGGPQQPASFRVQIRRQRRLMTEQYRFIALRATASQAGIVNVRVRDRANRLIASGTHPVYAAGTTNMHIRVTTSGRRVLRRAWKGLRIAVRHDFRDILATPTTGVTKGRLR